MQVEHRDYWLMSGVPEALQPGIPIEHIYFRNSVSREWVSWEPAVDMHQRDNGLAIWAALPGVEPDHVEVIMDGALLVLRGRRQLTVDFNAGNIFHLEIPYGPFERRITLPPGEYRVLERQLEHGCLRLHLECLS
jgi:HSP20 family molecular chaperone IbpA